MSMKLMVDCINFAYASPELAALVLLLPPDLETTQKGLGCGPIVLFNDQ